MVNGTPWPRYSWKETWYPLYRMLTYLNDGDQMLKLTLLINNFIILDNLWYFCNVTWLFKLFQKFKEAEEEYMFMWRHKTWFSCTTFFYYYYYYYTVASSGPGPPHSQGFWIWHNDSPQSVGLLWTSDQLVAETSTHHTHNRQTSIPLVGFKPPISAGEQPQPYALDRAANGTVMFYGL